MARQLDLFSAPHAAFDPAFDSLQRSLLAEDAWIDYAPGWVTGHDALFDQLASSLSWRTETRRMDDQEVLAPRLLASVPRELALVEAMRQALSARYGEGFVRTTVRLPQHGRERRRKQQVIDPQPQAAW